MSQITPTTDTVGIRPHQVFEKLDDGLAARLLPVGVLELIKTIDSGRIRGSERAETLGKLLSIELAVDDMERREILLSALPSDKIEELENRIGIGINELKGQRVIDSTIRRAFLGFLGFATTSDRTEGVSSRETIQPNRGLFPHQKRTASEVERYLYNEDGRAMLHLPTGVGKTRTAISIVASHLRSREMGLVVWLAATRELLEQASNEFKSTWESVGDRKVDNLRYWSTHDPPIDDVTDGIVFAGLAKLRHLGQERRRMWSLGDRTTFVVFDEAHQAVANTYKDIVETIVARNPRTPLLGLSATPGRTWGDPEKDAEVAELFFENKVTIGISGENPIKRLTNEGYLASVEFNLLNVKPGLRLSDRDLVEITNALDIPREIAERLGADTNRNLRITQRLIELAESHSRTLVFATSVDNAILLTSLCKGLGLEADVVTGKTPSVERDLIIRRFKRRGGPNRILVNFGVLTTGFDVPAASAAMIARPTKSLVLYSQMVGRVIRGPKAGGTDHCEIVTVVDTTIPGFGDVAEAFLNWEDVWSSP